MTTGIIICGALGKEVTDIVKKHGWDAEVTAIPAVVHVYPERIAQSVEERILEWRQKYSRLIVLFGDCGSKGAVDQMLAKYPDIERIAGPHCYEFYGGDLFDNLIKEEPGTYLLTDFMVRTFQGLIIKSMGLDNFPQLKKEYFHNYKRVVYLAQVDDDKLKQKAQEIAEYLELPLTIIHTGYGPFEQRLIAMMENSSSK
jgi:hypothetical protein